MVDLTVHGAGIFGLTIAWEGLQRGKTVRVIDPGGPGAGASGGLVGALQPHTPDPWNQKKQFQLESLLAAKQFWAGVEEVSGLSSGYARVGRLQPLSTERDVNLAEDRCAAAEKNWQGQADWKVVVTNDAGEWRPPSPTGLYLRDTLSAILHPRMATESLAAAIRVRGGEIAQDGSDTGTVIWATGWQGLEALSTALDRPVGGGVKGQAAVLAFNAAGAPQVFAEGLHFVPHLDGTVAIGSTTERDFDAPDTTDNALEEIIERARVLMPVLRNAPVQDKWAGVRPRARSRAPLLGPWPGRPGHFVANGGFKIGFGVAQRCAEVLLELVLEGKDTIPPEFHTDTLS